MTSLVVVRKFQANYTKTKHRKIMSRQNGLICGACQASEQPSVFFTVNALNKEPVIAQNAANFTRHANTVPKIILETLISMNTNLVCRRIDLLQLEGHLLKEALPLELVQVFQAQQLLFEVGKLIIRNRSTSTHCVVKV